MGDAPIRILLVEDNPADVGLLDHALRRVPGQRFTLAHAGQLKEIGGLLAKAKKEFDVLLLDLNLPDSQGLGTVARAAVLAPGLPIIVLTGVNDEAVGTEAVRQGAQDYLVKGEADGWHMRRAIRYAIERKAAQNELRKARDELEDRVRERTAQLQEAASELSRVEQRERQRLALVLHDGLQQLLTGARFNLQALKNRLQDEDLRPIVDIVDGLLAQSVQTSRGLAAELCPPVLHGQGLGGALKWLARHMQEVHGLMVNVEIIAEIPSDDGGAGAMLFQAVRELLFNVVKHAKTKSASVSMGRVEPDRICIVVSDEGAGFDPAALKADKGGDGGFGLYSIRDRLNLLGGRLEIESRPGHGSRFTLIMPSTRHEANGKGQEGTTPTKTEN